MSISFPEPPSYVVCVEGLPGPEAAAQKVIADVINAITDNYTVSCWNCSPTSWKMFLKSRKQVELEGK